MGCGCGGNKVKNVIQNRISRNSNRINISSTNSSNSSNTVQSLSAQNISGLSSGDRAKEKQRREILLKKLGRL
jgi:hypothetical protein